MFAAGYSTNWEVLSTLYALGATLDLQDTQGMSALMHAAGLNPEPLIVGWLIFMGADGALRSNEGRTAYDYSAWNEAVNHDEYASWYLYELAGGKTYGQIDGDFYYEVQFLDFVSGGDI
jgi:hypothetical protein